MEGGRFNISKNTITVNKDIEKLIKAEVFKKQIRIREFFFDFDRLRKGLVTEDKVKNLLFHRILFIFLNVQEYFNII